MKTPDECKKILFSLGIKLGVSPKLISTRLLNDLDKSDMMQGLIEISSLEAHTELWAKSGLPDYANGKTESYQEEKSRLAREAKREIETKAVYNKPFINYRCVD